MAGRPGRITAPGRIVPGLAVSGLVVSGLAGSGLAALVLGAGPASAAAVSMNTASTNTASTNTASISTASTNTASTVTCVYTFDAWSGGFAANVQITNNGPTPINGWTLRWTFAVPTAVTAGWSATITDPDSHTVSATNVVYNGVIGAGASTAFGWSAEAVSTSTPTDLTLNGMPC